jgi:hypothetical protein
MRSHHKVADVEEEEDPLRAAKISARHDRREVVVGRALQDPSVERVAGQLEKYPAASLVVKPEYRGLRRKK